MIQPIQSSDNSVKTSILYMNDFHGKLPNLERMCSATRAFDSFETSADKLKLSSGDDAVGEDKALTKAVSKLLELIGITTRQVGNHEFDANPEFHADNAKNASYKEVGGINIHIRPESKLNGVIANSIIEERNGNKYGIVGIGPSDMAERLKSGVSKEDLQVDDIDTTIINLQNEVNKLKEQGIDKIILLSHSGYTNDIKIAQQTSGIDVILGGHSHDLLTDINLGKNLFYNKDGEPVVITQAGKDGEHFGILNLVFDKDGVIRNAQNNIIETKNFNRTLPVKCAVEQIIGKPEYVGVINYAPPAPKNRLINPNPHAYFITDAMKNECNTDIALLNAANIRGFFEKGDVDTRMISEITPFKNKMVIVDINEKDVVDAIKYGGTSFSKPGNKPGLVMASGLKYTMDKKGNLLSLYYIDKNNNEIPIDINNPRQDKIYSVAMDDFYARGGDGFKMLNKIDNAKEVYPFDKDKLTCDYIKRINKPVDIIDDSRIQII